MVQICQQACAKCPIDINTCHEDNGKKVIDTKISIEACHATEADELKEDLNTRNTYLTFVPFENNFIKLATVWLLSLGVLRKAEIEDGIGCPRSS